MWLELEIRACSSLERADDLFNRKVLIIYKKAQPKEKENIDIGEWSGWERRED
jgi:hypothetical protein